MAEYITDVVFRTEKHGQFAGKVDAVCADIKGMGFSVYPSGDTYHNDWYVNRTRPSTPEEIARVLGRYDENLGGDTYSVRPVPRRKFS